MLHVVTCHRFTDFWIDRHLGSLRKFVPQPFFTHAILDSELWAEHAEKFDFCHRYEDLPKANRFRDGARDHAGGLEFLMGELRARAEPDDAVLVLDSDALLVADIGHYLEMIEGEADVVAVERSERLDYFPHPSFLLVKLRTYFDHGFDFLYDDDFTRDPRQRLSSRNPGFNIMNRILENDLVWHRMRKTREIDLDQCAFNVYDHTVYHHGAGARKIGSRKFSLPSHRHVIHKDLSKLEFEAFRERLGKVHRWMLGLIAADEEFYVDTHAKLQRAELAATAQQRDANRWARVSDIRTVSCSLERVILLHGLKRSGTHAIAGWIRGHGRIHFHSNLIPIAPILTGKGSVLPPRDFACLLQERGVLERLARSRYQQLVVGLEDHEPGITPFRNAPCEILHVLVLRDPYNLFASRIRKGTTGRGSLAFAPAHLPRFVALWKRHAREFLGRTRQLANAVFVDYDRWFASTDYRKRLSAELGFEFSDSEFSRVPDAGGGSSFDGQRFDGRNVEMNVLHRYQELHPEERAMLEKALADQEVRELADRIWSIPFGYG